MIVAERYAKSLMELAVETRKVEDVRKDMKLVEKVTRESHELFLMLKSPVVKTDRKIAVLEEIFKGKVSDLTLRFLRLITQKHRESLVKELTKAYNDIYNKQKNIFTAVVTSAQGLDDKTRKKMLELVQSQLNGEVELIEKIDPSAIGGFVLRIGDTQIDKTVSRQLSNLKKELINRGLN